MKNTKGFNFEEIETFKKSFKNGVCTGELTEYQAYDLALKAQANRMFADAHVLVSGKPSAIEAVVIELNEGITTFQS